MLRYQCTTGSLKKWASRRLLCGCRLGVSCTHWRSVGRGCTDRDRSQLSQPAHERRKESGCQPLQIDGCGSFPLRSSLPSSDEPANSDVDVGLAHQLAVMHDTAKQGCEHEADCDLGIDAGPTLVEAIQVGNFIPQPRKVENTIDAHEHMVIRNELS